MLWLAGDAKESTRLSQRVGHEVPGAVVWPLLLSEGWGGKCSEILATIKLLDNPRVNIVFTSLHFTSLHIHRPVVSLLCATKSYRVNRPLLLRIYVGHAHLLSLSHSGQLVTWCKLLLARSRLRLRAQEIWERDKGKMVAF